MSASAGLRTDVGPIVSSCRLLGCPHESSMAITRQDLIRQHLPEATRYLEKVLGRPIERLDYNGTQCVAIVPGGQVDCTDALRGWAEHSLQDLAEQSAQSPTPSEEVRDLSVN